MILNHWQISQETPQLPQSLFDEASDESSDESTMWSTKKQLVQIRIMQFLETEWKIYIKVKIPKVDANTLEIIATEQTILIQGTQQTTHELPGYYYDVEFGGGEFHSIIPLPSSINLNQTVASLNGDILNLALSKLQRNPQQVKLKLKH